MRCWTQVVVGLMVVGACLSVAPWSSAAAPAAETPKITNVDDAFKQLPTYEFGQSREALTVIADAVRDSQKNPADRKKLLARLTEILPSKASLDAKRFACRQLSIAGTAESVPPLAALLLDKDLSDYARYAMERIPDAAAVVAMREACGKATGKVKVGLINSLGERRDAQSAAALAASLKDADAMVASASAAALGKIGGNAAITALKAAKTGAAAELAPVIGDALLLAADGLLKDGKKDAAAAIYQEMYKPTEPKQIRMAALRGLIASQGEKAVAMLSEILGGTDAELQAAALRFLREVSGPDSAKTVAALLPKTPATGQAMLLEDLATRADVSVLPAVVEASKSQDANVRLAAIKAMGKLGNASALAFLTQTAASGAGAEQEAARRALDILPAADVNPAMLDLAAKGDVKIRAEVIRALGARRAAAAVPVLLAAAKDADAGVRTEALKSLDLVADEKAAPALAEIIAKAKDDGERAAAEKALGSLCSRAANKDACVDAILAAMGAAETPGKCGLIRVLGRAGTAKALTAVRTAVKDATPEIQDAGVRSLADWSDATAAADLLEIGKTGAKPAHQVLALRGYVRLAGDKAVPNAQKLKMYGEAMAAAKRPDEKKLVLGGLGSMKSPAALTMAAGCLDDAALQAEACSTAVNIAKNLGNQGKAEIAAAMAKVVTVAKDGNVKKEAENLLKAAGGAKPAVNKAPRIYKAPAEAPNAAAERLGWRVGIQAYSFNRFTFAEACEKGKACGVKYVEIFPGQKLSKEKPNVGTDHGMSDENIALMKKIAADNGLKIVNYGVVGLGNDEASARKVFEFAKKVGLETLVTENGENTFEMLDKLAAEYNVNIALHNHPKESHYWNPDTVLKGVEGRSKRIGSDADTGHWVRSGLVPLDCLKKLDGHIISLHFKDLKDGHDVPWGTGNGNARGMLEELKRQNFKGVFSIEYEYNWDNSVPDITKCVEWFYATAAELEKAGAKK